MIGPDDNKRDDDGDADDNESDDGDIGDVCFFMSVSSCREAPAENQNRHYEDECSLAAGAATAKRQVAALAIPSNYLPWLHSQRLFCLLMLVLEGLFLGRR